MRKTSTNTATSLSQNAISTSSNTPITRRKLPGQVPRKKWSKEGVPHKFLTTSTGKKAFFAGFKSQVGLERIFFLVLLESLFCQLIIWDF